MTIQDSGAANKTQTRIMTLHAHLSQRDHSNKVTLLVLGAGWTYQFLQPLLDKISPSISYAATTSTGHDNTIEFKFDPTSEDLEPFKRLPEADYVLVTFPLRGKGPSRKIVKMYWDTHPNCQRTKWIQLGSTGIYTTSDWVDCSTPFNPENERGIAEEELISLGGCVLNLAGLYGAQRQPRNWIDRVAKTKEQLGEKSALHLIHGHDVSRAIIAVVEQDRAARDAADAILSKKLFSRRWIINDLVCYDWWQIAWNYGGDTDDDTERTTSMPDARRQYREWVQQLMSEKGVRALPRSAELLGRKLDGREFWMTVGMAPERTS